MITFDQFIQIVLEYEKVRIANAHLDSYPSDYGELIVNDGYVNASMMFTERALEILLPDHYECLAWWMYEWKPGFIIRVDEKTYTIYNVDDYLTFKQETWD